MRTLFRRKQRGRGQRASEDKRKLPSIANTCRVRGHRIDLTLSSKCVPQIEGKSDN